MPDTSSTASAGQSLVTPTSVLAHDIRGDVLGFRRAPSDSNLRRAVVVGAELGLTGSLSLFAEATADYYFTQPTPPAAGGAPYNYDNFYPVFGVGLNFRL
ncbi:MAG: hypothetical protein U5L04_09385 [Trueperaceae bacterium]|nr:hypothetical protein [Trueperaceae bacterium]